MFDKRIQIILFFFLTSVAAGAIAGGAAMGFIGAILGGITGYLGSLTVIRNMN